MPRLYWKPILAVFLLAFGLRWYVQRHHAEERQNLPPFRQQEQEEETGNAADAAPASDVPGTPPDTAAEETPRKRGALTFDHDPVEVKPRAEDEEITTTFSFTNTSGKP